MSTEKTSRQRGIAALPLVLVAALFLGVMFFVNSSANERPAMAGQQQEPAGPMLDWPGYGQQGPMANQGPLPNQGPIPNQGPMATQAPMMQQKANPLQGPPVKVTSEYRQEYQRVVQTMAGPHANLQERMRALQRYDHSYRAHRALRL